MTSINKNLSLDVILTRDLDLLKTIAMNIGLDPDSSTLREDIKDYMLPNFDVTSFVKAMKNVEGNASVLVGTTSILPDSVSSQIFDIMSTLITILVYILIAVLIPLLVVVIFITSFSMIEDLFKRIALMKVMGMNGNEITRVLTLMYLPIVVLITLLGVGLMFGFIYGLQYMVYTATSIFISETISGAFFGIGFAVILLILALSIVFMYAKLKRKQIANAVKF